MMPSSDQSSTQQSPSEQLPTTRTSIHQSFVIHSDSPQTTFTLGQRLAECLHEESGTGLIIALQGDLGAGKTTLTQGIASGLGITQPITSPTFTFVNEYEIDAYQTGEQRAEQSHASARGLRSVDSRARLYHIDLYRLPEAPPQALAEADTFGLDDILDEVEDTQGGSLVITLIVIEWAERLGEHLPADHLAVYLQHAGDMANSDRRILTFTAGGPRSSALMAKLQLPR